MTPKATIAPFQVVFKVQPHRNEDGHPIVSPTKPFAPRKIHKKSRNGCQMCKIRRVKCDEIKPTCTKCVKSKLNCVYLSESTPAASPSSTMTLSRIDPTLCNMAVTLVDSQLDDLLFEVHPPGHAYPDDSNARMLHHFHNIVSRTIGSSIVQEAMHTSVSRLALSQAYLMHMVLAVSAAHQKRLLPYEGSSTAISVKEADHWQKGLGLFRTHLLDNGGKADSENEFDCNVAATVLTIIFTYALDDSLSLDSFRNPQSEKYNHALDPLATTNGFRAVGSSIAQLNPFSSWTKVLMSTDDEDGTFTKSGSGIQGLPRKFVALCQLTELSNTENNRYYSIVRLITPLLSLPPSTENFQILLAFSGRTWSAFKPLLLVQDARALLLLSYWLALLSQVNQWWLTTRAKTACAAIVNYLSTLNDFQIHSLLPFPSSFGKLSIDQMWLLLDDVISDLV